MGNAVGPVALIAAGIYLGYLTLTGKTSAFVSILKGTTPSTPAAAPQAVQNGTYLPSVVTTTPDLTSTASTAAALQNYNPASDLFALPATSSSSFALPSFTSAPLSSN